MEEKFTEFQPTIPVWFGPNSIDRLGEAALQLGGKRALLVSDPGIRKAGYVDRALQSLQKNGIEANAFCDVTENPTTRVVDSAVAFARAHGPVDLLIGLGGGSSMDVAKGVNFLLSNGGKMEDYWGAEKARLPMLSSIGIPTTAGTGSEAQSYALISQEQTHIKMACGDTKARFRIVILDPVLSLTAPRSVTAISGIDAIGHSVETFVTTNRNPYSKLFSLQAWTLLNSNFETVLSEPDNLEVRSAMLLGSYYAGIAIENSMLGAAHACANPLTSHYDITHGIAVGLMLPHVIRFNADLMSQEYEQLTHELGNRVIDLLEIAALPRTLTDLNVPEGDLPVLAKEASTQWTGKFNPRPLTESDSLDLYRAAL